MNEILVTVSGETLSDRPASDESIAGGERVEEGHTQDDDEDSEEC